MKKIIITGSEGLIGKKLVQKLQVLNDYKILPIDKDLGHDLTDEAEVKNIMKDNNDAEYLVNLFAINDHVEKGKENPSLFEISLDSLRTYFEINLTALFSVCRAFSKHTISPKSIINFSSLYGVRSPKKFLYNNTEKHIGYTISKHGVIGLTKHLSTHLHPTRVNCLVPGGVIHDQDPDFIKNYSKNVPLKRMMNPDELAGIVKLLCSEESSYINGAAIPIDGGWTAW